MSRVAVGISLAVARTTSITASPRSLTRCRSMRDAFPDRLDRQDHHRDGADGAGRAGTVDLDAPVRRYIPELRLQDEIGRPAGDRAATDSTTPPAGPATSSSTPATGTMPSPASWNAWWRPSRKRRWANASPTAIPPSASPAGDREGDRQAFETAIDELVFQPLGLTEHFVLPLGDHGAPLRRRPRAHAGSDVLVRTRSGHPREAGISATARDQIRYARFHLGMARTCCAPRRCSACRRARLPLATTRTGAGLRHLLDAA